MHHPPIILTTNIGLLVLPSITPSKSTGLSSGAKVVISIGVAVAGLLILVGLFYSVPRRRRKATDGETERRGLRQSMRNHIFASQQQEPIAENVDGSMARIVWEA